MPLHNPPKTLRLRLRWLRMHWLQGPERHMRGLLRCLPNTSISEGVWIPMGVDFESLKRWLHRKAISRIDDPCIIDIWWKDFVKKCLAFFVAHWRVHDVKSLLPFLQLLVRCGRTNCIKNVWLKRPGRVSAVWSIEAFCFQLYPLVN